VDGYTLAVGAGLDVDEVGWNVNITRVYSARLNSHMFWTQDVASVIMLTCNYCQFNLPIAHTEYADLPTLWKLNQLCNNFLARKGDSLCHGPSLTKHRMKIFGSTLLNPIYTLQGVPKVVLPRPHSRSRRKLLHTQPNGNWLNRPII
jgi:hypothetical protein